MTRCPCKGDVCRIDDSNFHVLAWKVQQWRIVENDPGHRLGFIANDHVSVEAVHFYRNAIDSFGKLACFIKVFPADSCKVEIIGTKIFSNVFSVKNGGRATAIKNKLLCGIEGLLRANGDPYSFNGNAKFDRVIDDTDI